MGMDTATVAAAQPLEHPLSMPPGPTAMDAVSSEQTRTVDRHNRCISNILIGFVSN